MNIVLIEPLGISNELLLDFAKKIEKLGHNFIYYNDKPIDDDEIIKRIKNQDIIMVANHPLSEDILKTNRNIKYIAVAFTGLDHVPLGYCQKNNIYVTNCSGYSTTSVSEQAIGMTLSLLRYLYLNNSITKEGKTNAVYGPGEEIRNKTIGIIGMGNIGMETARLFDAFGGKIIYYSRTKKEVKYEYVSLEYLLEHSDIISIHVPYNNNTHHLIDKNKLDLLKKEAILINTARGKVIDNNYLSLLLNNNKIKGAAIDVFDYEPPLKEDYSLLKAKNILLTPHTAFLTKEALIRRAKIEFDNVLKFLNR